jgi:D-serine deaminase-like pyridoxal phosphate-dependent protein
VLDLDGRRAFGHATVARVHQEHGEALPCRTCRWARGCASRPNHCCLTAAAHGRYHVVDGGRDVLATWERVNGW